jgi:hypothetical protein
MFAYVDMQTKQSGQALVLSLLLALVGSIAVLASFESGRFVLAKSRLFYASDAAAYSAAVVQARGLNTQAYLNRAQLAHQLAMAHLVTMASSAKMIGAQAQQAARRNPPATLVGAFFGPTFSTAYLASKTFAQQDKALLLEMGGAFRQHDQLIHGVIAQTRSALIHQLSHERNQVIEQVLLQNLNADLPHTQRKANLQTLKVTYQVDADALDQAIALQAGSAAVWHQTLKQVINKFGYLQDRDHLRTNWWFFLPRCVLPRPVLQRSGRTEIDAKGDWHAHDTQSFHALRFNRFIGCYRREYPMGWGVVGLTHTAYKLRDTDAAPANFANESYWRWALRQAGKAWDFVMGSDNRVAISWGRQQATKWSVQGMPKFAELKQDDKTSLGFRLSVRQEVSGLWLRSLGVYADSRAESYFEARQQTPAVVNAVANLFQPVWHARLAK